MSQDPILIAGCARSGTSLVAGIINICGAFGGSLIGSSRSNPKGMFENKTIREQVIKPYIKEVGADPRCQYPLPDTGGFWSRRSRRGIREDVLHIMELEGLNDDLPWFYKCPKIAHIWPVVHTAFPNAKWVIVRRRDEDIINSCLRTGFMRAFNDAGGWQWWIDQHKQRFQEMHDAGLAIKEIWPERMVRNDYSKMMEMIAWLGLEWKDQEIRSFIEPKLYKSKEGS